MGRVLHNWFRVGTGEGDSLVNFISTFWVLKWIVMESMCFRIIRSRAVFLDALIRHYEGVRRNQASPFTIKLKRLVLGRDIFGVVCIEIVRGRDGD